MCTGATDVSLIVLGVLFQIPQREWYMWCLLLGETTKHRSLLDENLLGGVMANDLDLVAYVVHLNIFAPFIVPLDNINSKLENTMVEWWPWGKISDQTKKCDPSSTRTYGFSFRQNLIHWLHT